MKLISYGQSAEAHAEQRRLLWRRSNNFSEHMDLMQGGSSKIRTAARPTHDGTHIADDAVPGLEKRSQECPPQYCIATIFKDASLDVVRDFFWDDDFRVKNTWDNICSTRLNDGCTKTGTMVVCWVRKVRYLRDIPGNISGMHYKLYKFCRHCLPCLCNFHSSATTGSMLSVAGSGHRERRTTALIRCFMKCPPSENTCHQNE